MTFTIPDGITGMPSDRCARMISADLGRLESVIDLAVDLARSTVELTSSRRPDRAVVEEAIDDAGFTFVSESDLRATLS